MFWTLVAPAKRISLLTAGSHHQATNWTERLKTWHLPATWKWLVSNLVEGHMLREFIWGTKIINKQPKKAMNVGKSPTYQLYTNIYVDVFFSKPFKGVFVGGCSIRWCITESTVNSNQHQQLAPTGHQTCTCTTTSSTSNNNNNKNDIYYFYYYLYTIFITIIIIIEFILLLLLYTFLLLNFIKFYSKPHLAWRLDLWHPAQQIQKQRQNHGFKWMVDRDSRYSSHPNGESSEMVTLSFQLSRFWFWFGDWSSRNMVHDFARSGAGSLVG